MAQIRNNVDEKSWFLLAATRARDRYPINPMEPTQSNIRVAFSFVERNIIEYSLI